MSESFSLAAALAARLQGATVELRQVSRFLLRILAEFSDELKGLNR